MQSGLVELFDQLRELRRRLNMTGVSIPSDEQASVIPLFTEVTKSSDLSPDDTHPESAISTVEPESHSVRPPPERSPKAITPEPNDSLESIELDIESESSERVPIGGAKAARVLDPIAHELRTGEAPASVLAEYLQSAKDYLFGGESSNERVERDMDVVLKFLRARNDKGIRPEERDNIMKRINRWKEALVET
jgi:hypothetical protein